PLPPPQPPQIHSSPGSRSPPHPRPLSLAEMRRREEMADAARARSTCRPGPNLPRTHLGSRGGGGSLRDDEAGSSEYICACLDKKKREVHMHTCS
ncbi:unnamed protein product, partial [Urochloa humidicola]